MNPWTWPLICLITKRVFFKSQRFTKIKFYCRSWKSSWPLKNNQKQLQTDGQSKRTFKDTNIPVNIFTTSFVAISLGTSLILFFASASAPRWIMIRRSFCFSTLLSILTPAAMWSGVSPPLVTACSLDTTSACCDGVSAQRKNLMRSRSIVSIANIRGVLLLLSSCNR